MSKPFSFLSDAWQRPARLPEGYLHCDLHPIAQPCYPQRAHNDLRLYDRKETIVVRRGRPPEQYETCYEIEGKASTGEVEFAIQTLMEARLVPVKTKFNAPGSLTAPVPAFVDVWEVFHHMGEAEHMAFLEILTKKAPISIRTAYAKRLTADLAVETIFGENPE